MFNCRKIASLGLGAAFIVASGCASLRPIAPESAKVVAATGNDLSVVEGRPNALVLNARLPSAKPGDRLRLLRHEQGGDTFALVEVPLDGEFLELAHTEGIGLSDDTVASGAHYTYEVVLLREEVVLETTSTAVAWGPKLGRPERVAADQLLDGVVEIRWDPAGPAALFVRDVLAESAPLQRIDVPVDANGRWVLTGLRTDGVYAVRVALARDDGGYARFGVPSEEVYVTLVPSREKGDAGSR